MKYKVTLPKSGIEVAVEAEENIIRVWDIRESWRTIFLRRDFDDTPSEDEIHAMLMETDNRMVVDVDNKQVVRDAIESFKKLTQ